jgi:hypothetical protein
VNVNGALIMAGGSITGSTGTAFGLAQGNSAVTYGGSISKTNGGRAVDVTARTGGTATFSGPVTATGASTGVNVSGPTAASNVVFPGAVDLGTSGTRLTGGTALTVNHGGSGSTTSFADLDVFTTGQQGINATNGGTLNVTTGRVDAGGRALNLDGVGLGATLSQVISSGSASEGVRLNNASGTLAVTSTTVTNAATQGISVAGTSASVTFASGAGTTNVSGTGTQRVLVGTTTGNVSFGNTTLAGGTDAVSLQNNTGGTRTFGTLAISGNSGVGVLHAVGGGSLTVTGAATVNAGGAGVQVDGNAAPSAIAFNSTLAVTRTTPGPGVLLAGAATNLGSINLGALSVTTSAGSAIQAGSAATTTPLSTVGTGVLSATGGAAIDARGTSFAASFASVSATGGTIPGLRLLASTGTLSMAGGTLTGHAITPTVQVDGGSVVASYAGTLTQNAANRSVDVQNTTGGTVSVATVTAGAASTGVNINAANGGVTFTSLTHGTSGTRTNNQAVTINGGTGTYSLGAVSLFTNGGAARGIFAANADGTLAITSGVVNAAGAAAIDIDGPAGLTTLGLALTSVHANGGQNGVLVRDTNGAMAVAGTGSAGTGGTIQNAAQRGARFTAATAISLSWMNFTNNGTANLDAAALCGDGLNGTNTNCAAGIDLQGVTGVTLDRLALSGGVQIGLNGNNVTDLAITNSTVQNAGNEVNEDGVQLVNLKGACTITDATFSGNFHRQMELQNSGAANTLTSLDITRVTFNRGTYVSTAAQGMLVAGHNGATMNVTVRDSDFLTNFGAGVFTQTVGTATTGTYTIGDVASPANGNVFTNNSLAGQFVSDSGAHTSTVANNQHTVTATVTAGATPFTFRKANPATGLYVGNFIANQIGNATAQSGTNCNGCNGLSITNEGVSGAQRMTVTNNVIRNVNQRGMEAILQLDDTMGVVVTGNTIQDPFDQPNHIGQAIFGQSNTDPADNGTMCMDVQSNTIGGSWDLAVGVARNIRLRQAGAGGTAPLRLRNIVGTTAVDANNYLNANNTNAAAACTAATAFTAGIAPCF